MIEIPVGFDVYQTIDFLTKQRQYIKLPAKPQPVNHDIALRYSQKLIEYAKAYEQYELRLAELKQQQADQNEINTGIDNQVEDYIKAEAGLDTLDISEAQKQKIWSKAWQDGHSGGYYEVYCKLSDLVELFQ